MEKIVNDLTCATNRLIIHTNTHTYIHTYTMIPSLKPGLHSNAHNARKWHNTRNINAYVASVACKEKCKQCKQQTQALSSSPIGCQLVFIVWKTGSILFLHFAMRGVLACMTCVHLFFTCGIVFLHFLRTLHILLAYFFLRKALRAFEWKPGFFTVSL